MTIYEYANLDIYMNIHVYIYDHIYIYIMFKYKTANL